VADLRTTYLGFELPHPFVAGASPLADDLDGVRLLEDAGAAAIVMRSLFEEQITRELFGRFERESHEESSAEATSYMPRADRFAFGPDDYLEHLRKVKAAVSVPVIGSLNGTTPGGWLEYARLMVAAGADAIELNLYSLALDPTVSSSEVEQLGLEVVREVRRAVNVPVAVKLSPFYASLAHYALRLELSGAHGLVLFNRFYQPDIDVELLRVRDELHLSSSSELPLRLRWVAALSGRLKCSLAVTGGIHTGIDAVKSIMAGADAVQVVSAILRHGLSRLRTMRLELEHWMEEREWDSVREMRGSMDLQRCPDPSAYERANYMLLLQGWRGAGAAVPSLR
jgi:dihydroorotate dehydrogenase (fumarate)